jgi:hypothetical protein
MIGCLAQWHAVRGSSKKTSSHLIANQERIITAQCLQNFIAGDWASRRLVVSHTSLVNQMLAVRELLYYSTSSAIPVGLALYYLDTLLFS